MTSRAPSPRRRRAGVRAARLLPALLGALLGALPAAALLPGCRGSAPPEPARASAVPAPRGPGPSSAGLSAAGLSAEGPGPDGLALLRRGRLEEAVERLRAERDAAPARVRTHLALVGALRRLGRRDEARREYAARAAAAGAAPVDRVLAEVLAGDGASSALRRAYRAASEAEPLEPWWLLAVAEVELAEAEAWSRRRSAAREQGDRDAEREAYAQARGALARAEPVLARASARGPDLAEPDLYLGHVRALEGDLQAGGVERQAAYGAARDAFERAVQRDPGLVEAWAALGDVRSRLGDSDEALEAWLEVARLAPDDASARLAVAVLLHQDGRWREAVRQYRAVAVLRPTDPGPWLPMGDALVELGALDEALAAYDEALVRDAGAVEAHARRGAVLEQRGRVAEAQAAYRRYVEQEGPDTREIQERLDRLLKLPARP